MKKKKIAGIKAVQIFFAIFFIVGSIMLVLLPFSNRNLELHFITSETELSILLSNDKIKEGACREIRIDNNRNTILFEKIEIYGSWKSMLLEEIRFDEFWGYVENITQGEARWTNEGIVFTSDDAIVLTMNDQYVLLMQELSQTLLQERIILIGVYFCLILFMVFVCNVIQERKTEGNWSNHGPVFEVRSFCGDIKRYRQYMVYAARTDLKAEVANSYLNRLWWLLEPFFNMIVYVVVFGNVMGNSVENYATFIFSALLMWNFFSKTINYSVKLVRNNKDIITKVYIPKFILLLSNMILNFFKLLFSLIVLIAMMLVFRIHIGWNFLWVFPAYIVMSLLAFGAGMLFLHFGVYVDDLSYAVSILLNMLMFLSGIFYNVMETLPQPLNSILMCLNPIAVVIDTMRNALLHNTIANLPALGMWFLIALILCCIGVHIVYKNENSYVKIV